MKKNFDGMTQNTYLVGVHRYSYRAGEVAEILGLKLVRPTGYDWRLCYEVRFLDGDIDYVAQADVDAGNAVIISDVQYASGQIPLITQ